MLIPIPDEFVEIAKQVASAAKQADEWERLEADDMFQTPSFVGGYDAVERAFCFSYFDEGRAEHWFQFTLDEIALVASGRLREMDVRPAK